MHRMNPWHQSWWKKNPNKTQQKCLHISLGILCITPGRTAVIMMFCQNRLYKRCIFMSIFSQRGMRPRQLGVGWAMIFYLNGTKTLEMSIKHDIWILSVWGNRTCLWIKRYICVWASCVQNIHCKIEMALEILNIPRRSKLLPICTHQQILNGHSWPVYSVGYISFMFMLLCIKHVSN